MQIDYSPLIRHLNALSKAERNEFAARCGTTVNYMRKRISLKRPFGVVISRNIAQSGLMKPHELRPEDWQMYVWR